ncbi:MAG TPA: glycosyl hydrolase [Planctomycetaceae bacterium]|nr:glycosyl hydrolase [Planctomycetaceae bacterium]
MLRRLVLLTVSLLWSDALYAEDLKVLFLGDQGAHQPRQRFDELAPVLASRGIAMKYTDDLAELTLENLENYDALAVYANIDQLDDQYADGILSYVAAGGGFVPIHCASFCFRNQPELVALMGAQFQRHGTGVFQARVTNNRHPVTDGFLGFRTWDETYVHHLHREEGRTILMYRIDASGREPWTWVKDYKQGRVFYTASGHDSRTWLNPGFQNLIERGIRWASGDDPSKAGDYISERPFDPPAMKSMADKSGSFEFIDVGPKIPNYTPSRQWGTQGEPKTLMQKPLPAEASIKRFVTPEGFKVERYADERDFESKPIAMTWDERGRLWICETLDYPNELGKGRDRIRICEDTDGDAVADKFTVFAEGLSIPTAIVIARGGAIVQNGTETIFLKDTDDDDVADERRTLITGWQLGDTHGGVSNFRYGLDNWIWAMQGYNNSQPEFNGQQTQSFRQGFFRFKLSTEGPVQVTALEFVRSSNNNTWGLGISEEGLIFGSTANGNPSMFMPIPNRYYERVRGWAPRTLGGIADTDRFKPITDKVRQVDYHGRYTAGAGHALYTARAFPEQWWNRTAFTCGPTGHLIGTFVLSPDGANYQSDSPINLVASDDEWSAPIMAEVGPDGAVWFLDWYNYIVQHNPTPRGFETGKGAAYESDLRDKRRGRIYRIVPEDQNRLHSLTSLAGVDASKIVETLRHPSMRWRLQAQRLLVEQAGTGEQLDSAVVEKLKSLVADNQVDAVGLNVAAIHALNTLAAITGIDQETAMLGLNHPSPGVRRNALAVLSHDQAGLTVLLQNRQVFSDANPQVRLQAILTLADMPSSSEAGMLVSELVGDTRDRVLLDALTSAAATQGEPFLTASSKIAATQRSPLTGIVRRIAEHVGRGRPDTATAAKIVGGLSNANTTIATAILDGMVAGLPSNTDFDSAAMDNALESVFDSVSAETQVKLLRLATRIGSEALNPKADAIVGGILNTLTNEDNQESTRIAAASDLIGFRSADSETVAAVLESITPQVSPEFANSLLSTLRQSQAENGGDEILEVVGSLSPAVKARAVDLLLSKPRWASSLMEAIAAREFDLDELSLEQKQALRSLPDEELQARADEVLAMSGGLPSADREKVLQQLMHITDMTGDPRAGKIAFTKACANCHRYRDIGQKIGPNLTGMAVHPKKELLTHIIDPSRSVEGNYRLYNVLTVDGTVVNGMLAGESRTTITLVDAQAKSRDILREDIEQLVVSKKSVMPEGFEQQLSKTELTDLLEFLTDTGPYVPFPLDNFATAISTKGLFSDSDSGPDRMVFEDWEPKEFRGIPFVLTNPNGKSTPNIILLHGPNAPLPRKMPRRISLELQSSIKAIHMLGGVGGWNYPYERRQSVSMTVRFTYADGKSEDHELRNGVHIADYIRRVDVPESEFAFALGNQQIRYLAIAPERDAVINTVELIKGNDQSAPIVMAMTVEKRSRQ